MYRRYTEDPNSVDESWRFFFSGFELGFARREQLGEGDDTGGSGSPPPPASLATASSTPGSSAPAKVPAPPAPDEDLDPGAGPVPSSGSCQDARGLPNCRDRRVLENGVDAPVAQDGGADLPPPKLRESSVYGLVNAFRTFGYMAADLNPLEEAPESHPFVDPAKFGIGPEDLGNPIGEGNWRGPSAATLGDLLQMLRETYCSTFAGEGMESIGPRTRSWLHRRIEPDLGKPHLDTKEKRNLLSLLLRAEALESFLHTKYLGQKRFSLEGAEALIPLLDEVITRGAGLGVEAFTLGMAHRGRLNVLVHTMDKPYQDLLTEFEGRSPHPGVVGDGDVKYHAGFANDRMVTVDGEQRQVALTLAPNPSHLELVDPVVEGMVRAKQARRGDRDRDKVVAIQIHGEAAFTGQGLVPETLLLSELPGYTTGGTIHVVLNNQVGFTATAEETRFTPHPTDIGRMIHAPIFHVNGDDPEAVVNAARIAIEFRQEFKTDVFLNLVCYRRHGHNETDDPTFTQPLMYRKIAAKKTVPELYVERLIAEGVVTQEVVDRLRDKLRVRLEGAKEIAERRAFVPSTDAFHGAWKGMHRAGTDWTADTRVDREALVEVGNGLTRAPEGFQVHRKLVRLLENRARMVRGEKPVDWGMAEALAYGTLLTEGYPVRLSGQDVQRGTFSHRHAVLHDFETGERFCPLANLSEDQAEFEIVNSMLSELAVLGFEFGMSWSDPNRLVIWEAQFGDFANGAQSIIDQFLSASESKWDRMSGLVMLLPHGYAGQGPEHSSARLERYLQLSAEDNWQVMNLTTPAQFFHALRRQMLRGFRKPMIVMSPKKLLRYERCISSIEDLVEGTFLPVLDDPTGPDPAKVRRVALCSGRVYYTLEEAGEKRDREDLALLRLEQIYPFPAKQLRRLLQRYPAATEFLWVQEEPENQGAWSFLRSRLGAILPEGATLSYRGREEAASTATGSHGQHIEEEEALIESVFSRG